MLSVNLISSAAPCFVGMTDQVTWVALTNSLFLHRIHLAGCIGCSEMSYFSYML